MGTDLDMDWETSTRSITESSISSMLLTDVGVFNNLSMIITIWLSQIHYDFTLINANSLWIHYFYRESTMNSLKLGKNRKGKKCWYACPENSITSVLVTDVGDELCWWPIKYNEKMGPIRPEKLRRRRRTPQSYFFRFWFVGTISFEMDNNRPRSSATFTKCSVV